MLFTEEKTYSPEALVLVSELYDGVTTRLKNIEFSRTAAMCTFLDPRFKLRGFTSESAKASLKKYVQELVVKLDGPNEDQTVDAPPSPKKKKNEKDDNELSVYALFDSIIENEPKRNATASAIVEVNR